MCIALGIIIKYKLLAKRKIREKKVAFSKYSPKRAGWV
jgi:hypothetical protein